MSDWETHIWWKEPPAPRCVGIQSLFHDFNPFNVTGRAQNSLTIMQWFENTDFCLRGSIFSQFIGENGSNKMATGPVLEIMPQNQLFFITMETLKVLGAHVTGQSVHDIILVETNNGRFQWKGFFSVSICFIGMNVTITSLPKHHKSVKENKCKTYTLDEFKEGKSSTVSLKLALSLSLSLSVVMSDHKCACVYQQEIMITKTKL